MSRLYTRALTRLSSVSYLIAGPLRDDVKLPASVPWRLLALPFISAAVTALLACLYWLPILIWEMTR